MTVREAFLRCMRFEPTDRVPHFELGYWGQTVERWIQEGAPAAEVEAGGLYGHDYFGIDHRPCLPVSFGPIPPLGGKVLEDTDRYTVFTDGDGCLHKALKEGTVRGTRLSMDQYISFAVSTPEDFERIKPHFDPASPGRRPDNLAELAASYADRTDPLCAVPNGAFGFFSHPRRFMGTENLSYAWHDQPRLMHEMLDFFADFVIETLRPCLEAIQPDYYNFFEDFAFKTAPLVSPAIFREFLMPRYRRILEFLRGYGVDIVWFDTDGHPEVLIPLLIETGITCLWPLEVAAGNDPRELRKRYGHDLVLSGGIDKRALFGDKAAIRAEMEAKIPRLLDEGGYIPTIDHAVSPEVSYENWLYYLELKAEMLGAEPPVLARERG